MEEKIVSHDFASAEAKLHGRASQEKDKSIHQNTHGRRQQVGWK